MENICFLFGHRETPESILPLIEEAIEAHYEQYHIRNLIIGHYGKFDSLAARAAISVKSRRPDLRVYLLLPYHPSIRPFPTPEGFDGTLYPEEMETTPPQFAITKANKTILSQASSIICYVSHPGNTRNLLETATKKSIPTTNLATSPKQT